MTGTGSVSGLDQATAIGSVLAAFAVLVLVCLLGNRADRRLRSWTARQRGLTTAAPVWRAPGRVAGWWWRREAARQAAAGLQGRSPIVITEVTADPADVAHIVTWTAAGDCRVRLTVSADQVAALHTALILADMARTDGPWEPAPTSLPEDLVLLPVGSGQVCYAQPDGDLTGVHRFTRLSVSPAAEGIALHAHALGLTPLPLGYLSSASVLARGYDLELLTVYVD